MNLAKEMLLTAKEEQFEILDTPITIQNSAFRNNSDDLYVTFQVGYSNNPSEIYEQEIRPLTIYNTINGKTITKFPIQVRVIHENSNNRLSINYYAAYYELSSESDEIINGYRYRTFTFVRKLPRTYNIFVIDIGIERSYN